MRSNRDISILLVDDDADLRSLMSEFFSEHGYQVTVAPDGARGLELARQPQFDLVILDVMMPALDGFAVLEQLRKTSKVPVIMLTARTETASRIHGLESGADDYLPKPFDPQELLARVRAILRRTQSEPAAGPVEVSGVRLDAASRTVFQHGKSVSLTSVEFDILEVLVRAAGRVVSRDELMQRLYQREATPFDRSIDVHVSHLRKKLEDSDNLIRTVRGVGYQFCKEMSEESAVAAE